MEHSFLFIEIYRGKLDWGFKHFERKKPNELTGITRVLETFTDISKKFESSQFPTIHFIIPYKNKLKKAWQPDLSDSDLFSNIKSNLLQQITQSILSCVTKFRKIALLLFLPKNKFLQFSTAEKKNLLNLKISKWKIKKIYQCMMIQREIPVKNGTSKELAKMP